MKDRLILVIAVFTLMFAFSGSAKGALTRAGEGLKLGNAVVFKPSVKIEESYDDNIFFNKDDEKSDFITSVTVDMNFALPLEDHLLGFGYRIKRIDFAEYTSESSTHHYLTATAKFNFNAFKVGMKAQHEYFFDRDASEYTARIKRERDNFDFGFQKEWTRLGVELGYRLRREKYLSDSVLDTVEGITRYYSDEDRWHNTFSTAATCRIAPHTKLFAEFDYGIVDYDTNINSDSRMFEYLAGIQRSSEAETGLDVKFRAGLRRQEYEEESEEDFDGYVAYLDFKETFNAYTTLALKLIRSIQESTYAANNYFEYDSIGVDYTHKFRGNPRLSLSLNGAFQQNRYPLISTEDGVSVRRRDDLWLAGITLSYDIQKWLSASVKYEYKERTSNHGSFDYDDNVITVGARLSY